MIYKRIGRLLISGIIFALIIFLPLALAQPGPTPGYSVLGKVTNSDGSAASGASIIITHVQTQETYTATANSTGWYVVNNIEAAVGDSLEIGASLGDSSGQGAATISATSPLYEVNITLEDSGSGFTPPLWLLVLAALVILIFLALIFLRGAKEVEKPPESPPKRRRK